MNALFTFEDDLDLFGAHNTLPRSRLFFLSPLGAGTPEQECLLSLIVRTCHAHAVNPRRMVTEIFPTVVPEIAKLAKATFFCSQAGSVNGLGQYAELFVSAMEQLTVQKGLRNLTMLPWRDVFPRNGQGLLARQRRWCPSCLDRQRSECCSASFPLAWSLEVYSTCPEHLCNLEDRCPHCGRAQPFLPRYPDLSICDYCREHLGCARPRQSGSATSRWVACALGDMIQRQSEPSFSPSARLFRTFLREQVAARANGNRAEFCRSIGFARDALHGWFNKDERPSITQFLSVCYGIQTLPSDVFGRSSSLDDSLGNLRRLPCKLKVRELRSRLPIERRNEIAQCVKAKVEEFCGEAVSSIAAGLGVKAGYLRYWFPGECAKLSEQYRAAIKTRSIARQEAQCRRLEEIVRKIAHQGKYPSRRRINGYLQKESMSLAQDHLNQALQKIFR